MLNTEYNILINRLVNKNSIKNTKPINLPYINKVKIEWVNFNDSILCLKCCKTFRTKIGYEKHNCLQENE